MDLRKELIDFYCWCLQNNIDHNIDIRIEKAVDRYLKSIKSNTEDDKICLHCNGKGYKYLAERVTQDCKYCNGKGKLSRNS